MNASGIAIAIAVLDKGKDMAVVIMVGTLRQKEEESIFVDR